MQSGYRFRCYPTAAQQQVLLQWMGCQRFIYNAKVSEDRYYRSFARKSLALAGQFAPIDQQYSQFKTSDTEWLSDVPSQLLRNGAVLWKQAYGRFFQKLGGRPVFKRKSGKQSVWITSELFAFQSVADQKTGEITGWKLSVGTKKHPLGQLACNAHRSFQEAPASIHISLQAGRWYLSITLDEGAPEPDEADTIRYLMQFTENELRAVSVGVDRGVAVPVATSDGRQFGFSAVQQKRLDKQERYKERWQRRQARRTKGSCNWHKARKKVARYQRYGVDVRRDVAHKTSFNLVADDAIRLLVFEALKVQNMTRSAKGTADSPGKNVRQKAGLNKSMLAAAWGQMLAYCLYKARRVGKLVITVPAQYSSQECAQCGYIHPDNRMSQSEFLCQSCGHKDNADHNAAKVIAARGVRLLLSGAYSPQARKRCRPKKQKVGGVTSEPDASPTPDETTVRRRAACSTAHRSLNQETPATAPGA